MSLPASSPHSWEKTHVNDNAYKLNSWSNCAVDINVFECVCVCVCVCVCGTWYLYGKHTAECGYQ